jgi:hypothetical protein
LLNPLQDSIDPIDGVERSTLVMASTVHGRPAADLVLPAHVARAQALAPSLFVPPGAAG